LIFLELTLQPFVIGTIIQKPKDREMPKHLPLALFLLRLGVFIVFLLREYDTLTLSRQPVSATASAGSAISTI